MYPLDEQMLTCSHCGGLTPPDASTTCLHCDEPLKRPPRWFLKMTALLGPAGAILLAACYGAPGRYLREPARSDGVTRVDQDGDGAYGPWVCSDYAASKCTPSYLASLRPPDDVDCNDRDPSMYPGAPDPDGDGVDQNCDGVDGWRDRDPDRTYATPPPSSSPPAKVAVPPEP